MKNFFEGLEHSKSFSFMINDNGNMVPKKDVQYTLFEGEYFPFVLFAEELHAINDYCYTVINSIESECGKANEEVIKQRKEQRSDDVFFRFTSYEMLMGLEEDLYTWRWIYDITAAHLVVLLYAYLEKTLKYIYKWYVEEKIIKPSSNNKKTPKMFKLIYNILETNKRDFIQTAPEIYNILENARKMRNNFAHDNLEGKNLDFHEDYIYAERSFMPTFKLTNLFDAITLILFNVEKIYIRKISD